MTGHKWSVNISSFRPSPFLIPMEILQIFQSSYPSSPKSSIQLNILSFLESFLIRLAPELQDREIKLTQLKIPQWLA